MFAQKRLHYKWVNTIAVFIVNLRAFTASVMMLRVWKNRPFSAKFNGRYIYGGHDAICPGS
jgi:hypothetical protein